MNSRIVIILLIAAIVLSALSIILTLTFDASNSVVTKTVVKENDVDSANVGLIIQEVLPVLV